MGRATFNRVMEYRVIADCKYGKEGTKVPSSIWYGATPRERQLYFRVQYENVDDWGTTSWYNTTVSDDRGED